MTGQDRLDTWVQGDPYEAYVGRWSRAVAREFLRSLRVPERREWLDVGCGTGALAQTIVEHAAPAAVVGIDRSEGFVANARRRVTDPRARFEIGDAQALPVASGAFDAVVSGLVLNFVPEPPRMLSEMTRATRAGGTVALYVWDYTGAMEIMRRYAVSLPEERRDELRERIRAGMPVGPDGSIRLTARAWAARGTEVAAQQRG